jgi:hypothetical protein
MDAVFHTVFRHVRRRRRGRPFTLSHHALRDQGGDKALGESGGKGGAQRAVAVRDWRRGLSGLLLAGIQTLCILLEGLGKGLPGWSVVFGNYLIGLREGLEPRWS